MSPSPENIFFRYNILLSEQLASAIVYFITKEQLCQSTVKQLGNEAFTRLFWFAQGQTLFNSE